MRTGIVGSACFWLALLSASAQTGERASGFTLAGTLIDYATHRPVRGGQVRIRLAGRTDALSTSDDAGTFTGRVPLAVTALVIECGGYERQVIPLHLGTVPKKTSVSALIPLVDTTGQAINKPYPQAKQTAYVQQRTDSSATRQHATFRVYDAVRNAPVVATVCLFYTRTGRKTCLTTDEKGITRIDFSEQDIVALEVSAPDYQEYAGNLIVERLGGQRVQHDIRLQRTPTLLAVQATGASRCTIRTAAGSDTLTALAAGQFAAYGLLPGRCEITVRYGAKNDRRVVQLRSGLNYVTFAPDSAEKKVAPLPVAALVSERKTVATAASLSLRDSVPLIYFEQSSYVLKTESQDVLQQVARFMKQHPDCTLEITGHTDNVGSADLNQTLSLYRAMVTGNFLARQGIADERFVKLGAGGSEPLVANDTEANKARNRRVSLKLILP